MAEMMPLSSSSEAEATASRVTELPIATLVASLSKGDVAEDQNTTQSLAWDTTFTHNQSPSAPPKTLCTHAFAVDSHVIHYSQQWITDLERKILTVTSNADGSVIVAATDSGNVVLLRGYDGVILATHNVNGSGDSESFPDMEPPEISWIPGCQNQDAFWMEGAPDYTSDDDDNPHQLFVLVSNIQGHRLNSMDPAVTAQATRQMSLSTLSLPSATWRAAVGFFMDTKQAALGSNSGESLTPKVIRIVTCEDDGSLAVYDHDIPGQATSLVRHGIVLHNYSPAAQDQTAVVTSDEWFVDYELGMRTQVFRDKVYVLVTGSHGSHTSLYWFDPVALEPACALEAKVWNYQSTDRNEMERKHKTGTSSPKILAMEPLPDKETLAVAVAISSPVSESVNIQVIRVLAEETFGLTILSKPHVLYEIPVGNSVTGLEMAAAAESVPFSFCFKTPADAKISKYNMFTPGSSGKTLGRLRSLLENESYDELEREMEVSAVAVVVDDPLAVFSPAEIAFKQLQSILSRGCLGLATSLQRAKHCLNQLATSAAAGHASAIDYLIKATELFINSMPDLALVEMIIVFQALSHALKRASSSEHHESVVNAKVHELEQRIRALKFLENAVPTEDGSKIPVTTYWKSVRSPRHLFSVFMEHGFFCMAEKLWRSQLRPFMTPDVVVGSLFRISGDIRPQRYVHILSDVIFPSLSIGHELLGPVRSWVCRTADALDEASHEKGLTDAIFLLEAASRSVNTLQLGVHESFAITSPFRGRDDVQLVKRTPRSSSSNISSLTTSRDVSMFVSDSVTDGTKAPSVFRSIGGGMHPSPTLLQLGVLDRGAIKTRVSTMLPADSRYDNDNHCIETKLREARCLHKARLAGLGKKTTLATLAERGGARFVATQLVSLYSSETNSHDTRFECLSNHIRPFCEEFKIDYDAVIYETIRCRCNGKGATARAIDESGSLARCCQSSETKSEAALLVLQAALLRCHFPDWLADLARDAKAWASFDSGLQVKLQEAWRLLSITCIVVKYCGKSAQDLFRIDNPRHAMRLMDYVAQHPHRQCVLDDVSALCNAFNHLNLRDSCCKLLQHAILRGEELFCQSLMVDVCERDISLGESVLAGAVFFAEQLLIECNEELRTATLKEVQALAAKGKDVVRCVDSIITVALKYTSTLSISAAAEIMDFLTEGSLALLQEDVRRIRRLQSEFSIFLSLSDLTSTATAARTLSALLQPVIEAHSSDNSLFLFANQIAAAKRACSLIVKGSKLDEQHVWMSVCANEVVGLIENVPDCKVLDILQSLGLLEQVSVRAPAHAQLSVALALCLKRQHCQEPAVVVNGHMPRLVEAAVLVRNYSIAASTDRDLGAALTLSSVVDIVSEILTRADEGMGDKLDRLRGAMEVDVWKKRLPPSLAVGSNSSRVSVARTVLHRHWYIGDGLLLPPDESLNHSLHICNDLLSEKFSCLREVLEFLQLSGAYALTIRLASVFTSRFAASRSLEAFDGVLHDAIHRSIQQTTMSIAERSLGGSSHTGMTSSVVDSEMAAASLLALPPTDAVEIYKSSLPTALKTRDFERAYALAITGTMLCLMEGDPNVPLGGFFAVGWKGRERFCVPCQHLALRALWWSVLTEYGVEFDTQSFEASRGKINKQYVISLLPRLIEGMFEKLNSSALLRGCFAMASAFGLTQNDVLREHIRFLLTVDECCLTSKDVRTNFDVCEKMAKRLLRMLQPAAAQCDILYDCLHQRESTAGCQKQYERFALVLSLYQDALEFVLDHDTSSSSVDVAHYERVHEAVCRRRDALSILTSIFSGDRAKDRPSFPQLFLPLDTSVEKQHSTVVCDILGHAATGDSDKCYFDPIDPLSKILSDFTEFSAVASLGPLCLSLGLPTGYIHARALVENFKNAKTESSNYPSFENDVLTTLARIRSPQDRLILMDWCAQQYDNSDDDRLKCLELAHSAAIQASDEIEKLRRSSADSKQLELAENRALATLKRLDTAKAALSDRLKVISILRAAVPCSQDIIACITEELIHRLGLQVKNEPDMPPESLVNFLLANASLLAAETCLSFEEPASIEHLRHFRSTINEACQAIAEQYSHIDILSACKRFAWVWLFHGAGAHDSFSQTKGTDAPHSTHPPLSTTIATEETIDFVMDLSDLLAGEAESHVPARSTDPKLTTTRYTSDEEQSAIRSRSARELSESACQQEALRIAFVLSFEDTADYSRDEADDRENNGHSGSNVLVSRRSGLLGKIETKRDNPQEVMLTRICRWLLTIVFSKSGQTSAQLYGDASFSDTIDSQVTAMAGPATVTFAMRHRALRTAAVLCPQEALERVIQEDGLLRKTSSGNEVTLRDCAFASLVAKEIEEMGLPLPHSDLDRLGSMQYPSYARTLWRHHREDSKVGQRGRLLLLLMEMSLKGDTVDVVFVNTLLQEMMKHHLPRSLLLAIERIVLHGAQSGSQLALPGSALVSSIETTARAIFAESARILGSCDVVDKASVADAVNSISRLGEAIIAMSSTSEGQALFDLFVSVLRNECSKTNAGNAAKALNRILVNALRRQKQKKFDTPIGSKHDVSFATLDDALHHIEASFSIT